jgi:hypothetical protein
MREKKREGERFFVCHLLQYFFLQKKTCSKLFVNIYNFIKNILSIATSSLTLCGYEMNNRNNYDRKTICSLSLSTNQNPFHKQV